MKFHGRSVRHHAEHTLRSYKVDTVAPWIVTIHWDNTSFYLCCSPKRIATMWCAYNYKNISNCLLAKRKSFQHVKTLSPLLNVKFVNCRCATQNVPFLYSFASCHVFFHSLSLFLSPALDFTPTFFSLSVPLSIPHSLAPQLSDCSVFPLPLCK